MAISESGYLGSCREIWAYREKAMPGTSAKTRMVVLTAIPNVPPPPPRRAQKRSAF
jgi:hypothetical protein